MNVVSWRSQTNNDMVIWDSFNEHQHLHEPIRKQEQFEKSTLWIQRCRALFDKDTADVICRFDRGGSSPFYHHGSDDSQRIDSLKSDKMTELVTNAMKQHYCFANHQMFQYLQK
jgi:hypothetical protein